MRSLADLQRDPSADAPEAPAALPIAVQRRRTFETPEFAGMEFLEVEAKTALNRVKGMPFEWSLNPYRGCSHSCKYCFARPTHKYLNLSPLGDFERKVIVKTNVVEVLRRELAKPSWKGAHVAMGTNTDNYQRCEGRYRLMPGIIDALTEAYTPFSILTKGTLILRDLDRLVAARERVDVSASFTIGMLDTEVWRDAEPGTPSPRARLDAVAKLNAAGIPTGVMLAPIMPGLNDHPDQITAVVDAAVRARATQIHPIVLHLRPGVREVFWPWLERAHPELVGRYAELYRKTQAPKEYRDDIAKTVRRAQEAAWRRHGRPEPPAPWRRAGTDGPAAPGRTTDDEAAGTQLRLDL